MAVVTIELEREEAIGLLEALASARDRALHASETAQGRHDEDERVDCCQEAVTLGRICRRLEGALADR